MIGYIIHASLLGSFIAKSSSSKIFQIQAEALIELKKKSFAL